MIAYTITATFPDDATALEYIAWLRAGHLEEVLRAGASTAAIVHQTDPKDPITVETRYTFGSMDELDRYVRERAPVLRAQGLARFPPQRGVHYQRRIAVFVGPVLGLSSQETTPWPTRS